MKLLKYLSGGQTPQVKADFASGAKYMAAAPLTPESLYLTALAELLIKSNQTQAGLDELRAASRLDAQNAAVWERIGDVGESLNHTNEARDAYAAALKLESEKSDQKRVRTKMAF